MFAITWDLVMFAITVSSLAEIEALGEHREIWEGEAEEEVGERILVLADKLE